ncbi:MAG: hypothetical protein AAGF12_14935 [Myxococcota bacterium]
MRPLCLAVLVALVACSDDPPADVAGDYTANVTNGPNQCNLDTWNEGSTLSGIPIQVSQEGASVTAEVGGGVGLFLDVWLGARSFEGGVTGSRIDAVLFGQNPNRVGGCTFTIDAELEATLQGDLLEGAVQFRPSTSSHPDCLTFANCSNGQAFNGTRPPR